MIQTGVIKVSLGIAFATSIAGIWPTPTLAQSVQRSMKISCGDSSRGFALRAKGTEGLAVADPQAVSELRQAALIFYRCSQKEQDTYLHALFEAYYANTLYRVGLETSDDRAKSLAVTAAAPLRNSTNPDVRNLVAKVLPPTASRPANNSQQITQSSPSHSTAYCTTFRSSVQQSLYKLNDAVMDAINAGTNDTEVLAATTSRYGSAFKAVEDDYTSAQEPLSEAQSHISDANNTITSLSDVEQPGATKVVNALQLVAKYTETYLRVALNFERNVNGANRRLAMARVSQSLASMQHDTSYTYTNSNASCFSYSSTTDCNGNSNSTTTYNNSASLAQERAADTLALAEAGRLSYGQTDEVLSQGLSLLSQAQEALTGAVTSWNKGCS